MPKKESIILGVFVAAAVGSAGYASWRQLTHYDRLRPEFIEAVRILRDRDAPTEAKEAISRKDFRLIFMQSGWGETEFPGLECETPPGPLKRDADLKEGYSTGDVGRNAEEEQYDLLYYRFASAYNRTIIASGNSRPGWNCSLRN